MAGPTMVFTTYLFVFYFLPLVLVFYYALDGLSRQAGASDGRTCLVLNALLVLASYIFYGWWNPWFIFLMLGVTVVNYVCGRFIGLPGISRRLSSWVVTCAIVMSLGTLGFFKYFLFFEANLNQVLGLVRSRHRASARDHLAHRDLVLHVPCAQLHDRRLSRHGASRPVVHRFRLLHFALSPARRRAHHPLQHGGRSARVAALTPGKSLPPGSPCSSSASPRRSCWPIRWAGSRTPRSTAQSLSAPDAWFGVLAYAFQIYFDFSGYSDMAIGLGRMIGFEFLKNFDSPYQAESITDFWRRWHISLSTFLRDYLYIPLGGNRKGSRTHLRQPHRRHASGRAVAWRELDVRRLGGLSRDPAGLRAIPGQAQRVSTMAAAGPRGGHVRAGARSRGSCFARRICTRP